LLDIYEAHTAETWATVGQIVEELEKHHVRFETQDKDEGRKHLKK